MSLEEQNQKRIELNDELNIYKKKWNIIETNRSVWSNIKKRLQTGKNKSQKTFSYHFRRSLAAAILGSVFLILPLTIPLAMFLYSISGYHGIRMIIFGYCFLKLKKGIETTNKINNIYTNKKLAIEKNEEIIYKQLDQLNEFPSVTATHSLLKECIERTEQHSKNNDLTL